MLHGGYLVAAFLGMISWEADDPIEAGRVSAIARRAQAADVPAEPGLRARDSYRPNDPDRPTVVLVHGINSTSGSFRHLAPALEAHGFGVVTYDYPSDRDLDESARAFAESWLAFRRDRNEERSWSILTHSMGALLARAYVEGPSYGDDVSHLLLIGPPNRGAAVAKGQTLLQLARGVRAASDPGRRANQEAALAEGLGESAEDLVPGSRFLHALNARPRREGVEYHILAGRSGFLSAEDRRLVEGRLALASRAGGLLGGLTRLAVGDASGMLDEMTDGTGDGCVSVASTFLDGVEDRVVIDANHVALIRGPLLYPEPGPIACLPFVLERLKPARR